jgi:hypothetical protein
MVMAAIDGFAALFTGQRHYFHASGSAASEGRGEELASQCARESGEEP